MGTPNFFKKHAVQTSGQNLEARAIGASSYSSRASGGSAAKDIAASKAAVANGLKPLTKTAATGAPGPKKV